MQPFFISGRAPPSAREAMLQAFLICQLPSNISAWGKTIG
jgi:hypothetical protein